MAFEDKKGIVVASPFKLQAEALLDVRQQVDTIAERDRLVTLKAATAGLRVFVKENSTSYVYTGSKWDTLTTGAPYKHPTGDGNHHVPATGTTNSGKFLKAGATAGSEAWAKIAASDITGLPTKLPNPNSLKFTGAVTATYDGSGAVTVNIPTAQASPFALTVQLNGGTAEGTNKFTFNGGAAKNINITPAAIGAAAAGHTHTPTSIGAAASNHTHQYAGSSSAGGAANSAVKLTTARTINGVSFDGTKNIEIPNSYAKQLTSEDLNTVLTAGNYFGAGRNTVKNKPSGVEYFGMKVYKIASGVIAQKLHGSNNVIYYRVYNNSSFGSWYKVYSSASKPTPAEIGAAAASHTHTASQVTGLPTSLKNPHALTIKTNGTSAAVYDGSAVKEVNITAASIGAAASSHGHSVFKAATASAAGGTGFVPAPAAGKHTAFLRGDGTWQPITHSLSALGVTATAAELNYMKGVTSAVQTQLNGKSPTSHTHTPASIGAAPASHNHNYAGSSSSGGAANSAKKVDLPVGTILWSTSSSASFFAATCGGTWSVLGKIDALVNATSTVVMYIHKKTAL